MKQDPTVKAFLSHRDSCETCREAAGPRQACEEGRRLHEEMVLAAQRDRPS